jgi:hypothetical protein
MDESVPFGGGAYWLAFSLLCFGRGMDFFSTWVATPNLKLEANPLARKLGWKWGGVVNLILCLVAARWPVPAIVIVTTSLLVAARNFRSAWWIRSVGEDRYRVWVAESLSKSSLSLYVLCSLGETILTGLLGVAIFYFGEASDALAAIAIGIIAYALAVGFYTLLSVWKFKREQMRELDLVSK